VSHPLKTPGALGPTLALGAALAAAVLAGCGTTRTSYSARTATEQLLISDAIDRTVQQLDFKAFEGEPVFFDERHLLEVVDKGYLISSLRQRLLASGCILKDKREDATYVLEPRVGAIGTDNYDLLFGIPALQVPQVAIAPTLPAAIPEIPFAKRRDQRGVAKLAVFAYRRETGEPVWQSGIALSESQANDIWVLGAGPFKRGTIYEGARFAGGRIEDDDDAAAPAGRVASVDEQAFFKGAPHKEPAGPAADGAVVHAVAETPAAGGEVAQAAVEAPAAPGGPPVLPPRPIAEAPPPATTTDDPAATAG
jgi:hypothetical protein